MLTSTRALRLTGIPFFAATMLASAPAMAETMTNKGLPPTDPILAYAEQTAPSNQFFLNSADDVELVRYKRVHDLNVCAGRGGDGIGDARHGYPIQVSWDSDTAVVMPGNCLSFDAQRVRVRPASRLPENVELTGTIRVVR